MAGLGLLAGLAAGFSTAGNDYMAQQKEKRAQAAEVQKLQLMNKLNMDLMKAKYQFAQQNPTYKHFMTDLSSNLIGVDQNGNAKILHEATPEEKGLALQKVRAQIAVNQANADRAAIVGANTGALNPYQIPLIQANTTKALAEADKARRPSASKAGPDPMVITPQQKEDMVKKGMSADILKHFEPGDPEYQEDYDRAAKKVDGMGYKVLTGPGQGKGLIAPQAPTADFGVFGAGVPGAAEPTAPGDIATDGSVTSDPDDEEETDSYGNVMGM